MAYKCDMQEARGIELVKLEKKGDEISGVLFNCEVKNIEVIENGRAIRKDVPVYQLAEVDDEGQQTGREFEFMQAADLRTKLRDLDKGRFVSVRCVGEQKVKNGNMRVFDVRKSTNIVLPQFAGNIHGQKITDQDIPF